MPINQTAHHGLKFIIEKENHDQRGGYLSLVEE